MEWQTAGRVAVGLLLPALVVGCSGVSDVPFGARATERVWCADADGVVDTVTVQGHDGPLTDLEVQVVDLGAGAVSEQDLIDACAGRFGWWTGTTLCEAYAAPEDLERLAASEFVSEHYGDTGSDRPGFPVVVRDRVSCEQVQLQAGPAAAVAAANDFPSADRLREWEATQRFNDWRAREAAWRDAADGGCLDIDTARDHAMAGQAELAGDWPVFETARDPGDPSHAGLCLDVRLQREGFIEIRYHAVETPLGRPDAVDDVTDIVEPDSPIAR
jgi:hypothetical protein